MKLQHSIISILAAISLTLGGCVNVKQVPTLLENPASDLKKGQLVTLYMTNGDVHEMLVEEVTESQVRGRNVKAPSDQVAYAYEDITDVRAVVRKEQFDGRKTIALLGGILAVPVFLVLATARAFCTTCSN